MSFAWNSAEARSAVLVEGEHFWVEFHGRDSCLWCMIVRRKDGLPQSVCRGRVKVGLR